MLLFSHTVSASCFCNFLMFVTHTLPQPVYVYIFQQHMQILASILPRTGSGVTWEQGYMQIQYSDTCVHLGWKSLCSLLELHACGFM